MILVLEYVDRLIKCNYLIRRSPLEIGGLMHPQHSMRFAFKNWIVYMVKIWRIYRADVSLVGQKFIDIWI